MAKGQTALPPGIADTLASTATIEMQLVGSNGACFGEMQLVGSNGACFGVMLFDVSNVPGYVKAK